MLRNLVAVFLVSKRRFAKQTGYNESFASYLPYTCRLCANFPLNGNKRWKFRLALRLSDPSAKTV